MDGNKVSFNFHIVVTILAEGEQSKAMYNTRKDKAEYVWQYCSVISEFFICHCKIES